MVPNSPWVGSPWVGSISLLGRPRIRDAHDGLRRVAEHGFAHHVLHKDAWDVLKARWASANGPQPLKTAQKASIPCFAYF